MADTDDTPQMPPAWAELIEALTMVAGRPQTNPISPFHCEHDTLMLMAAPDDFTPEEIEHLDRLGFFVDGDDTFSSYRYGSA